MNRVARNFRLIRNLPMMAANVEQNQDSLATTKNWIKDHPQLKARTDDQWLLNFLRKFDFDIDKTKERIEFFYKFKNAEPQLFSNRDPMSPEIQEILNRGIFIPVINNTDHGSPVILIVRWKNTHAKKTTFLNMIKVAIMFLDVLVYEGNTFLTGEQQFVEDCDGFSMRYYTQMTPGAWKKLIGGTHDAYPTKIKKYHIINAPSYYGIMYSLVRPFMKDDVKKKLNILNRSKLAKLHNDIPKSVLPKEYGGEGPSVEEIAATWKIKIEEYRDWFLDDVEYKFIEDKVKKPK